MDLRVYSPVLRNSSGTPERLGEIFGNIITFPEKKSDLDSLIWSLTNCPKNSYCLFIKPNSIPSLGNEKIREFLKGLHTDWDLFYLCKWLDRCDLYDDYGEIGPIKTVRTYFPNGIQALIVSPEGRGKILKYGFSEEFHLVSKIREGGLVAYCSTLNIFQVDPETDGDAAKYFTCQAVYPPEKPDFADMEVVSNLQNQIQDIKHEIEPETKKLTAYERFNSLDVFFFMKIFYLIIMISLIVDIFLKVYREKKRNYV